MCFEDQDTFLLNRLQLVLIIFIWLFFVPDVAAENGSMPYKNINKILTLVKQHTTSPYAGLVATLELNDKALTMQDIQLSIVHKGNVIKQLFPDKHGFVQFELLAQEIAESALVIINQPRGKVAMRLAAGVQPIKSEQVSYDALFSVLDDLENVATDMIGLPSWLLPDLDYLEFYFESQAVITVMGTDLKSTYKSNVEHVIKIEKNADLSHANAMLIFSQLPIDVKFL
jgi:hypothetical protein